MRNAAELPFVVKICGITNEEDARAAVEAGANALGFNFWPRSPRCIAPEAAARIVSRVPGDYLKVGVFVNTSADEMLGIAAEVPLDVLQLHGEQIAIPERMPCRVWRAIAAENLPKNDASGFDAYLVDTPTPDFGGSGKTFDWTVAAGRKYPIVLAGGLAADNVREAIETVRPWGVDACSRLELAPGRKDIQRVREFIRAAQAASQRL
ncbi:MAG: phosphoribosylanthranilate isomerase [Acidobacteriaceae bacterium]|nr:phosphoribosylanthranilate isomerase [Acidobacteriaceae bacterium]